jgi:uncharacterized protein
MSPPSEVLSPQSPASSEYSLEERRILLRLARQAITTAFSGERLDLTAPTEHLAEKRGAFTSLRIEGKLRGCIGYVAAHHPLYRTVAETAQAAAFDDPRFPPVMPAEAPGLDIEISVLSSLKPIEPEGVIIGRHGLLVSKNGRRGLLLPQVPLEWGWERETFLAQTCLKAGLPPDAWRQGAEIKAFTAEVFNDAEFVRPSY